jgi:hypothetical protein
MVPNLQAAIVGVAIYMHISTVDVTEPPQPLDYESTTADRTRTIGRRPYIVAAQPLRNVVPGDEAGEGFLRAQRGPELLWLCLVRKSKLL